MKKLIFTICLALASMLSFAQNSTKGKVSGMLLDEKKQALPFANVLLLKAQDSTLAKANVSDIEGKFLFENVNTNNETGYLISVSMVGYKKYFSPKFILNNENLELNMASIQLELDTKNLKEVSVTAKKPFIEQTADKLVVNVEGSIVANGNTALEVLQKSPGITVDNNDNIAVKGKQGVMILMDGKQTYMSQSDLANLLKNMTSDQIEKIEVISNPSSRYDAAGKAVINIITKKNKMYGTNGSASIGTARSLAPTLETGLSKDFLTTEKLLPNLMPKYNVSLNLNNRQGKFNSFLNLTLNDNKRFNSNVFSRDLGGKTFEQFAHRYNESQNFSYKLGSDFYATKKTTWGILINGNTGMWQTQPGGPNKNITYIKNQGSIIPDSSLVTIADPYERWNNKTFNTNFKHTFDSTGQEITADIDYSMYKNLNGERGMVTSFYKFIDQNAIEINKPLTITSNTPNKYNIFAVKTDYVLPLGKIKGKLELGAKSSFVKSDNDFRFYQNGEVDKGRTNYFIYQENINALYSNFNKELSKKFNLQAGLRMEHTKSEGHSVTLNEKRNREYVNLFPSIFLTQTLNKNNQITYSYSRRIERPDYESLNPFINFLDPYTYQIGNAYLKPQYTNSFELSHSFKQAFVTSIGYAKTNDYMMEVIKNAKDQPEILEKIKKYNNIDGIDPEKITFAIRENIANYENLNINFSVPVPVNKWWTMQNNFTLFFNKYSGELLNQNLNVSQWAYNFYTSQNLKLPKELSAEVSMWYNSPNIYGMMKGNAQYAVNVGLQKNLWNKKGNLKFSMNDIFLTSFWNGQTDYAGVKMTLKNRWDSRAARLTFTYKFGNQNVKAARRRSTATEAEQSRVKSGN